MIVSGLLAAVLVLAVLRARADTVLVAVSRAEIPAGATVGAGEVKWVEVAADSPLLSAMVGKARLGSEPWVAGRRVAKNDPITRDVLRTAAAPSSLRAMSVPVASEHAVGGALTAGDRIDVIDVREDSSTYVLQDAEVLAVGGGRTGGIGSVAGGGFHVTVALDDEAALRLAFGMADGKIEIVRSTGARPATTPGLEFGPER
jgi:Flp pilus assembly protein CpaB